MAEADDEPFESFSNAELGAMAHLYRGEIYRSTIWRTRLDATTNWAVVSLGLALSITYADPAASSLPLLLVTFLIMVFLYLESRRYRYFNVWRARARWLEINFYAPLLRRQKHPEEGKWQDRLALDYERPEHHISFSRALGRRLRRNYLWIFSVQFLAYIGKNIIHPGHLESRAEFFSRLSIGAVPGEAVLSTVITAYVGVSGFTLFMYLQDKKRFRESPNPISMG
ncbi:DUF2270 domain-containing protein [Parvularcula sp. LCG005]|uniref:DUF2270 domain-containing protein n=1 Tax=Parvularcula sp. LCG005 TaxID=3078805 RepID=UPI002942C5F1|nr:DUF2270 domain-containing protein [Parvularcula sp. LCG005]WOI53855.1 DUF2270 domain-containing protein [Parvularcula sp. LCG005]